MKRIGKQGLINQKANKKLVNIFRVMDITSCEIRLPGCLNNSFLGFAHRHKRVFYRKCPELLSDLNQVVLACVSCHQKIERNKELTEQIFDKLRHEHL